MLDTIPHSDFCALQETHLPGIEQMAPAQRWSRKRGWAAAFQGAEVVGQHHAANTGGVAIAGPLHISSSVPTEFESMLEEVAVLAPEGVEHPLHYLRSRTLARHTHAMLKRGVTLVTVYLEPGMRVLGLTLWPLEVLAACILCWITMGDWTMESHELSQAGWLNTVNGKIFAISAATCAGGAGAVLDYFVLSEAMAHLVLQIEVVDNSPTTHSPVRLILTATSWGHRVLAQCQWDRNAGSRGTPCRRSGAGVAGVAARSRGCLVPHSRPPRSSTQASGEEQRVGHWAHLPGTSHAQERQEGLQQKGSCVARASTHCGSGSGKLGCLEEGADTPAHASTFSLHGCRHLVARLWLLGPSYHKRHLQTPCAKQSPARIGQIWSGESCFSSRATRSTRSMFRRPNLREAGDSGQRKPGRTANAKQLGDQEDWGDPLPRPSLEEVDDVCKTYKSTAGLGHDCINPVELRVRFIDLLMAFEAKLVKPLCWAHMMFLRPEPTGGHRTIGLTVAPLRVLSRF